MIFSRVVVLGIVLAAAVFAPCSIASAQEEPEADPSAADRAPEPAPQSTKLLRLLYVRGKALMVGPASAPEPGEKVLDLPLTGKYEIRRIETASDGSAALVVLGTKAGALYIDLSAATRSAEAIECPGEVHLDPPGNCTLCAVGDGSAQMRRLRPEKTRKEKAIPDVGKEIAFYAGPRTLVAHGEDGVWAISIRRPEERRQLAPAPPETHLSVAPDGRRAVGTYPEGVEGGRGLYTLALDGKGVRRRLNAGGTPVSWSQDSQWLVVQDGDRPCVVRAVGGQHKCWKGYRGIGVDPDVKQLLMLGSKAGKGGARDLYLGSLAGAHTANPTRVAREVQAAAYLSAPPPPAN